LSWSKLNFKVSERVWHQCSFGRTDDELSKFELIINWFSIGIKYGEGEVGSFVYSAEAEIVSFRDRHLKGFFIF
jgi:hypothetical protein